MSYGVFLVNLGSPESTSTSDVRGYLREFLSDDRVLDSPKIIQQFVLNFLILPKRPAESAHAYKSIWTDEGSPLVVSTFRQAELLREVVDIPVVVGMRYGQPSTRQGLEDLQKQGVKKILLIPLYPHYAMSSFETAVVKVQQELEKMGSPMELTTQAPFYKDEDYIEALVDYSLTQLPEDYDLLLFSYHSIPEHHLYKPDPVGHCLASQDCCSTPSPCHAFCYRAQVFETTRRFVERAKIPKDKWKISFQSRLGRRPWLTPRTENVFEELPSQGYKNIAVISASFISDCLETLEELDIRGQDTFMKAGGESYTAIRCLNEDEGWIGVLKRMVDDFTNEKTQEAKLAATAEYGFSAWLKRLFSSSGKAPQPRLNSPKSTDIPSGLV